MVGGNKVVGLHPIMFGDAEDGLPRLYLMNGIAFSDLARGVAKAKRRASKDGFWISEVIQLDQALHRYPGLGSNAGKSIAVHDQVVFCLTVRARSGRTNENQRESDG